jgi:AcrR family transcriptional regulator
MGGRQEHEVEPGRGRERQKNRTRRALIAAATTLVREGANPTVAAVAEAAEISRATAYRYFPTQEMLMAEVALFGVIDPLFPETDGDGALPAPDAAARLVREVGSWAYENEAALRTLLRISLDPSSEVRRPGHRTGWIADLLAPVRGELDDDTYERLGASLTLLMGIDPVVVMTDIANVPREQALDTLEWTARTLVEAALAESRRRRRKTPARRA